MNGYLARWLPTQSQEKLISARPGSNLASSSTGNLDLHPHRRGRAKDWIEGKGFRATVFVIDEFVVLFPGDTQQPFYRGLPEI